jgi:hypothetical protein
MIDNICDVCCMTRTKEIVLNHLSRWESSFILIRTCFHDFIREGWLMNSYSSFHIFISSK